MADDWRNPLRRLWKCPEKQQVDARRWYDLHPQAQMYDMRAWKQRGRKRPKTHKQVMNAFGSATARAIESTKLQRQRLRAEGRERKAERRAQ